MSATKNMAESLREVVQDLLVPELKSVQISVGFLRAGMKLRDEKMEQLVHMGDEKIEERIRQDDEKGEQAIKSLSEKLHFAIDIRERVASLEARAPRQ